jgi:hypothetical protein
MQNEINFSAFSIDKVFLENQNNEDFSSTIMNFRNMNGKFLFHFQINFYRQVFPSSRRR